MKKLDSLLLKLFLYGLILPAGLGILLLLFGGEGVPDAPAGVRTLYNIGGLGFVVWALTTFYICLKLLFSEPFRDVVLSKITFLRERDEREALLAGKATKATFLVSLAMLFFLLCISCFRVSVYRLPPEKAINGKTGVVSLGLQFSPVNTTTERADDGRKDLFSYSALPLSNSAILLFLILLQIAAYNFYVRRAK